MATQKKPATKPAPGLPPERAALVGPKNGKPMQGPAKAPAKKPNVFDPKKPDFSKVSARRKKTSDSADRGYDRAIHIHIHSGSK